MDNPALITLTEQLAMVTEASSLKDKILFNVLSVAINELAKNDFEKLITVLYRMDIDEQRLRALLSREKNINAGELIAGMMIERQIQKIESRKLHKSQPPPDITDEELW